VCKECAAAALLRVAMATRCRASAQSRAAAQRVLHARMRAFARHIKNANPLLRQQRVGDFAMREGMMYRDARRRRVRQAEAKRECAKINEVMRAGGGVGSSVQSVVCV